LGGTAVGLEEKEFKRGTIIAAAAMLKALGHSGLDKFLLELDLPDDRIGQGSGLEARTNSLAQFALKNPEFITAEGTRIGTEIFGRARQILERGQSNNLGERDLSDFRAAMEGDDVSFTPVGGPGTDRPAPPAWARPMPPELHSSRSTPPWAGNESAQSPAPSSNRKSSRKVFIVHGHAGEEHRVARFLDKIKFDPIILSEQPDGGKTIVEKLEANSDVGFAVVLLTPDDEGAEKGKPPQGRARQNVILEWGYFAGKLGRDKVCALKLGNVEIPSDFLGLVWKEFDTAGAWKTALARELATAGFDIDWEAVSKA
jgi:hypothetical protein